MVAASDEKQVFQLGVDAGCVLLNIPVNHNALTAVAQMPLSWGFDPKRPTFLESEAHAIACSRRGKYQDLYWVIKEIPLSAKEHHKLRVNVVNARALDHIPTWTIPEMRPTSRHHKNWAATASIRKGLEWKDSPIFTPKGKAG
jgi:hypothetical protein